MKKEKYNMIALRVENGGYKINRWKKSERELSLCQSRAT